jgi:uncharacterized protein with PIN domain
MTAKPLTPDEFVAFKGHLTALIVDDDNLARLYATVEALTARLDAAHNARCPRCGEWVRDFPAVRAATADPTPQTDDDIEPDKPI